MKSRESLQLEHIYMNFKVDFICSLSAFWSTLDFFIPSLQPCDGYLLVLQELRVVFYHSPNVFKLYNDVKTASSRREIRASFKSGNKICQTLEDLNIITRMWKNKHCCLLLMLYILILLSISLQCCSDCNPKLYPGCS